MDDSVVFGWFFDFACAKMWKEFEAHQTLDKQSKRQFMTGLLQYATDDVAERIVRVDFLQLLCLLSDGDQPDLKFESVSKTSERGKERTPLEHALVLLQKLEGREMMQHLSDQLHQTSFLIKVQAVMVLLRKDRRKEAFALCLELWPKSRGQDKEEGEVIQTLRDLCEGKKKRSFNAAHTMEQFYAQIMPTLSAVNKSFQDPFLLKVLNRKEEMERETEKALTIPCSVLKRACGPTVWRKALAATEQMAKEAWSSVSSSHNTRTPSSPSSSSPQRNERKRKPASSSSESEATSPLKRGKSIRSIQYAKTKRAPSTTQAEKGEAVDWDQSDEEEEGLESKKLHTPKVRRSLGGKSSSHHKTSSDESKVRRPWTEEEEEELREGIRRYGVGKWAEIKLAFNLDGRTNVQLKDKYRNLVKNGLI